MASISDPQLLHQSDLVISLKVVFYGQTLCSFALLCVPVTSHSDKRLCV